MSEKQLGLVPFSPTWTIIILIHPRIHQLEIILSAMLFPVFYFDFSFAHFLFDHHTFTSKREHPPYIATVTRSSSIAAQNCFHTTI